MQFSSRLPIAVHILLAIVEFEGKEKTTSTFLAGSVNVNPVIIRNTLGQLKAAGLVTVKAGEGGASLAKEPKDITLMDVFDAVEKEEALFHFHENPNPECPVGKMFILYWITSSLLFKRQCGKRWTRLLCRI